MDRPIKSSTRHGVDKAKLHISSRLKKSQSRSMRSIQPTVWAICHQNEWCYDAASKYANLGFAAMCAGLGTLAETTTLAWEANVRAAIVMLGLLEISLAAIDIGPKGFSE
jgi:hypothetical protein